MRFAFASLIVSIREATISQTPPFSYVRDTFRHSRITADNQTARYNMSNSSFDTWKTIVTTLEESGV
ncbi:hypothetical protein Plhal304r1_c013g0049261 [Plasmopara halstedii]